MKVYREGKFVESEYYDQFDFKEEDTEETWEKRLGNHTLTEGSEFNFEFKIYSIPKFPDAKMFVVSNANTWDLFITETFEDYLYFWEKFKKMLFHSTVTEKLTDLVEPFMRKVFEAWHEHSLDIDCYNCDKQAMEQRIAMRQMRKEQKEKEAGNVKN